MSGRFRHLIEHVYGPYPDVFLLKESLKPKPGNNDEFIDMYNMQLYAGNKHVGLNETEYIVRPPPASIVHHKHPQHAPITFCGIVEIRELSWLTKTGEDYLQIDVRNLDKEHGMGEVHSINLAQVLQASNGRGIKVNLMCHKNQLASFLTAEKLANRHQELLMYSLSLVSGKKIDRKFAIKSLHVETYAASREFLARYRLRALLAELSKLDNGLTPVEHRGIDWVINAYMLHIIPRDMDDERRRKLRPLMLQKPQYSDDLRHPRHVPLSHLRSELANHCEWILANQIGKKPSATAAETSLLSIPLWVEWCQDAYLASLEAKKNGERWGMSESLSDMKKPKPYNLEQRLSKYGASPEFWKPQLDNWNNAFERYLENKANKPPPVDRSLALPPAPISGGLEWDSDFSPDWTTDEWSDSDVDATQLNDQLGGLSFCSQPPRIPLGSFLWHCPGPGCQKVINLLKLSPDDIEILSPDLLNGLAKKPWKAQDKHVQDALAAIVSEHYQQEHLATAGFEKFATKKGPQFRPSQPSERRDLRQPRRRAGSVQVKEEDSD